MRYAGKQIAILGAGKSGIAAARLASREGAAVVVCDTGDPLVLAEKAEQLAAEGIEMKAGEAALSDPGACDLAVVSPGIDLRVPLAKVFSDRGVAMIGEIEFADQLVDWPVVAITGTNGKTTTTELVECILNGCGQRTVAAGNYGRAYADVVLSGQDYDAITLEMSSFQLETITDFRPSISVWMNFAPDHLDRYDGVEDYREAKLRIFENQTAEDFAVVNLRDDVGELKPQTVTFSAFTRGGDYWLDEGEIVYRGDAVCDLDATQLRGTHNAENLMAALAVGHLRGLSFGAMTASVRDYKTPPHRSEWVGAVGGCDCINDSKATNLHALEQSLLSQPGRVVLIAGGKDKGLPFAELAETVADKASHVVAIGETAGEIVDAWSSSVPCEAADGLDDAVRRARSAADAGQVILFSPGTSSFDMFGGYEERGDAFREIITRIQ